MDEYKFANDICRPNQAPQRMNIDLGHDESMKIMKDARHCKVNKFKETLENYGRDELIELVDNMDDSLVYAANQIKFLGDKIKALELEKEPAVQEMPRTKGDILGYTSYDKREVLEMEKNDFISLLDKIHAEAILISKENLFYISSWKSEIDKCNGKEVVISNLEAKIRMLEEENNA